jgi:hypothetical protein
MARSGSRRKTRPGSTWPTATSGPSWQGTSCGRPARPGTKPAVGGCRRHDRGVPRLPPLIRTPPRRPQRLVWRRPASGRGDRPTGPGASGGDTAQSGPTDGCRTALSRLPPDYDGVRIAEGRSPLNWPSLVSASCNSSPSMTEAPIARKQSQPSRPETRRSWGMAYKSQWPYACRLGSGAESKDVDVNGWGINPPTIEAAATAVAAAAIIFAWLSLRESKAQRRSSEAEISARVRPWIGLFDFRFEGSRKGESKLCFLLRNFGPLPAQQARLKLVIEAPGIPVGVEPSSINLQESGEKALMPTEEGNYTIDTESQPRLKEWITADHEIVIKGTFEYALAGRRFQSQFQATVWSSRHEPAAAPTLEGWKKVTWQVQRRLGLVSNHPADAPVSTNWKNISAI